MNEDVKLDVPVCDAKQARCEFESALRRQTLYPTELRARGLQFVQFKLINSHFAISRFGMLRIWFAFNGRGGGFEPRASCARGRL